MHVEGSGRITVVGAAEVQFSSMDSVGEGQPVCLLGVKLHILTQGAPFNLHTQALVAKLRSQSATCPMALLTGKAGSKEVDEKDLVAAIEQHGG